MEVSRPLLHLQLGLLVVSDRHHALTLETAIEATKRGAHDFLPKPFTPEDLRVAVRRVVRHLLVQREARRLADSG